MGKGGKELSPSFGSRDQVIDQVDSEQSDKRQHSGRFNMVDMHTLLLPCSFWFAYPSRCKLLVSCSKQ
jgi:hypothetical protein